MSSVQSEDNRYERDAIVTWLRRELARMLDLSPAEVETDRSLMAYGLDSSAALAMTEKLSRWLGRDVDPSIVLEHPTIDGLVDVLESGRR